MLYTTEYPYNITANTHETDNIKITINTKYSSLNNVLRLLRYSTESTFAYFYDMIYEFKTQTIIPKVVHYRNNDTCVNAKISVYGYDNNTNKYELLGDKQFSIEMFENQEIGRGIIVTDIILNTNKCYNKIKITDSTISILSNNIQPSVSYCILDYEPVTGRMIKNQVKNAIMQNELLKKITIPYNAE